MRAKKSSFASSKKCKWSYVGYYQLGHCENQWWEHRWQEQETIWRWLQERLSQWYKVWLVQPEIWELLQRELSRWECWFLYIQPLRVLLLLDYLLQVHYPHEHCKQLITFHFFVVYMKRFLQEQVVNVLCWIL